MDTIATLAWTLLTLGGDTVDARSWQGQPVVVHVWATWCAPCVTELRRVERWWQHQQALDSTRHLRLIVVSPEPLSHVRKFVKRHRLTLPIYVEHSRIPDIYKLRVLPSTFILDNKGTLIQRLEGTQSWDIQAQRPTDRHPARVSTATPTVEGSP